MNHKITLIVVIVAIFVTACAPKIPPREELVHDLPVQSREVGRIYFFLGFYSTLNLNKYGSAGSIIIDDNIVGMVNKNECIAIDIPPGTYNISWKPILADIDMKKHHSEILPIEIKSGEIKYVSTNTKDSGPWGYFGVIGMLSSNILWIDYLSLEPSVPNNIKLVDFINMMDN